MKRGVRAARALFFVASALGTSKLAEAYELPELQGSPVVLDVTETSILAQRFSAREGENESDQGYLSWLNRLNAVLAWKHVTLGLRLDSSLYAFRPEDRAVFDATRARNLRIDGAMRFRDSLYPAKLFLTYKTKVAELTLGDAYAQFGRGLVLSMRKVDELGIDTTLFGGKLVVTEGPFSFSLIAGVTNPARIDEPTGRALFLPKSLDDATGSQPVFGSDRMIGASISAGRGQAVVASTHAVLLARCAPYRYGDTGAIVDTPFDKPFGTCEESDRETFLQSIPPLNPVLSARRVINASESIEVPSLWGHGNLYIEGAVQKRDLARSTDDNTQGNALYGAISAHGGRVTNTVEFKSYRNFYPLMASVNASRASAFANIAYSAPPTAEPVTSDAMFGSFNVCVTGARDRFDYRINDSLLAYGTLGFFASLSEQPGAQCDALGRNRAQKKAESSNDVLDASLGMEWRFDDDKSFAFVNLSARHDQKGNGDPYYREVAIQYTVSKQIQGPYSVELAGRHRYRSLDRENLRDDSFAGVPWRQGEHQNALKIAPKWVLAQGFEYTTQLGLPTYYVNGSVLYKFTSQSNLRIYGGQNRGGLRCVSGICRMFPAFSGVRAELTLRF